MAKIEVRHLVRLRLNSSRPLRRKLDSSPQNCGVVLVLSVPKTSFVLIWRRRSVSDNPGALRSTAPKNSRTACPSRGYTKRSGLFRRQRVRNDDAVRQLENFHDPTHSWRLNLSEEHALYRI